LVETSRTDLTEALVRAGAVFADANLVSRNGRGKMIYTAFLYGHHKAVEAMLECGAPPNESLATSTGKSLAHLAAENGHEEVLEAFVRAGGDVELLDASGASPLRSAVNSHAWGCVKALLTRHGARLNAKELLGLYLCDFVRRLVEDYKALADACDAGNSAAVHATLAGLASDVSAAESLEEAGAAPVRLPLDTRNEDGDTLLDRAAAAGRPDVVEALLTRWPTDAAAVEQAQRARLEAARVFAATQARSELLVKLYAGKSTRDAIVASDAAAAGGTRGY
jgi:ankyrin repeat protein